MGNIEVTVVTLQQVYPDTTAEPEAMLVISDKENEIRVEIEQFIGLVDAVYRSIGIAGDEEDTGTYEPEPEPETVVQRPSSRLVVKQSKVDGDI